MLFNECDYNNSQSLLLRQISTVILIPRLRCLFSIIYQKTMDFQFFCVKFRAAVVLSRSGYSCLWNDCHIARL